MPSAKRKRSPLDFFCGCFRADVMSPDVINIDIAKPVQHARGMSMSHHLDNVPTLGDVKGNAYRPGLPF